MGVHLLTLFTPYEGSTLPRLMKQIHMITTACAYISKGVAADTNADAYVKMYR